MTFVGRRLKADDHWKSARLLNSNAQWLGIEDLLVDEKVEAQPLE